MKKKILMYDDDEDILFVCMIMLEKNNYAVEVKARCKDIIADVFEMKPDLILIDYLMPGMDGKAAITLLKETTSTQNIPVLLFSAHGDIEAISKEVNSDGYIAKPFDIEDFTRIIEEKLNAQTIS